jgi:WD repeat-containing protein 1 (actin-interacting protein 1)
MFLIRELAISLLEYLMYASLSVSIHYLISGSKGPQKAITSVAPTSLGTFVAGTADGRIVSYVPHTGEASHLSGQGHTNLVSGLASSDSGKTYSIGFDDRVRESDGKSFT